jgi:DNA-binding NtrC family response regulator
MARRSKNVDPEFEEEIHALVETLMTTHRAWSLRRARRVFERSYCQYMLRRSNGDRHLSAKRLDIGFSTLKEKIRDD